MGHLSPRWYHQPQSGHHRAGLAGQVAHPSPQCSSNGTIIEDTKQCYLSPIVCTVPLPRLVCGTLTGSVCLWDLATCHPTQQYSSTSSRLDKSCVWSVRPCPQVSLWLGVRVLKIKHNNSGKSAQLPNYVHKAYLFIEKCSMTKNN